LYGILFVDGDVLPSFRLWTYSITFPFSIYDFWLPLLVWSNCSHSRTRRVL